MPRGDWQKARDQDTRREASAEFLKFGKYRSFESVYSGLTPERDEPEVTESWDLVNWLNDLRSPFLEETRSHVPRIEGPLSEKHADIVPLLIFAMFPTTPSHQKGRPIASERRPSQRDQKQQGSRPGTPPLDPDA